MAPLDAPLARFPPAVLKSFRHPRRGVPIFDRDSEEGYQNFMETPRGGGMHFLRALFPKSTTPPPQQEILDSP